MNPGLLVGVGACLVVVGFVMRGIARGNRRDQAYRKQHDLSACEPDDDNQPDVIDRHLEKWLPRYATACIAAGFATVLTGLLLR